MILSQSRLNPTAYQAVLLLQRTQDLMLECPAVARQLWQHSQERPGPPSSTHTAWWSRLAKWGLCPLCTRPWSCSGSRWTQPGNIGWTSKARS